MDGSSEIVGGGGGSNNLQNNNEEDELDLRRGQWTVDEDLTLINYITTHGEGRWNSLARSAGLKRTGQSCRLRWLNYLHPDVRRGNITLEEQLLILELHSRFGNRWSKIALYLPGRTDNEIRNYWRTRLQKHAKQLKCDVNSKQFRNTMMPRLVEGLQASAAAVSISPPPPAASSASISLPPPAAAASSISISPPPPATSPSPNHNNNNFQFITGGSSNCTAASSDSFRSTQVSNFTDYYYYAC